jgi:LysR family hydrogen peroxide-inducible transcriptional activator
LFFLWLWAGGWAAGGFHTFIFYPDLFFGAAGGFQRGAAPTAVTTDSLRGQELLLLEDGHCLRDHALEACKLRAREFRVPYQATSLTTVVQMVASGIGVTLLPGMAVDGDALSAPGVVVRPFSDSGVSRDIGLMWRRKTPRAAEFRLLGDYITRTAAETAARAG